MTRTEPPPPGAGGEVALLIPGEAASVQLARLVGAAIAGRIGFDVEEIEDLRIAIDELCVALLDLGVTGLELRFRGESGALVVEGRAPVGGSVAAPPTLDALSAQIVAAVSDHHEIGGDGDHVWFRLRKAHVET